MNDVKILCNFEFVFTVNTKAVPTLSYSFNSGQVGYCGYLIIMLSELRIRLRCRQLESQMFIEKQVKGRQRSVIQGRVNKVQNSRQSWGQERQRFVNGSESGRYRKAGRLRVRAGRTVRTGKTRKQNLKKAGRWENTLVRSDKMNWQQTNREHRHNYTEDNGEEV